MANPPVFDSIDKNDVPELKQADRLLKPLSEFMQQTKACLDSGITSRNLAAYVRTIEVVGVDEGQDALLPVDVGTSGDPSTAGPPEFNPRNPPAWPKPIQMVLGEQGKPFPGEVQEVRVLQVKRADGNLPGPVSVEGWQAGPISKDGRRTLTLPRVNGLSPNVRYTLTLLIQAV